MNPVKLKWIGVALGFIVMYLATSYFIRTYRSGDPQWNLVFMTFGMALILFYTLFRKRR